MKQVNPKELHEVVGKLLLDEGGFRIGGLDAYGRFFTDLAELVGDYAGVYVTGDADDFTDEWLVGLEADDSTPDPCVFDTYDPEGEWDRA